ncbi:MAG: hypothetical protein V4505_09495 [Pseudomonadota bacterium]
MKRLLAALAAFMASMLVLASCGGGGDGGGTVVPPAAFALAVSVNGSAAAPDASGTYRIKPGDTVQAVPSQPATWSSSGSDNNAADARNPSVSTTRWSAPIINYLPSTETFTLNAQAVASGSNPGPITSASFLVSAGDTRNASYRVFAGNGTQQTLALSFDTLSYRMADPAGVVATDTFSADTSEPGTWLLQSQRSTALPGRFRLTGGALVGMFPFAVPSFPANYQQQSFMAANNFVAGQAAFDGFYNQLGLELGPPSASVASVWIRNGGTQLLRCLSSTVRADQCPGGSLATYTVSPDAATPGSWTLVNTANAADTGKFMVASVGGKNVLLSALSSANSGYLRIGLTGTLAVSAQPAHAGDTTGTWGTLALDTANYSYTPLAGTGTTYSGPVQALADPTTASGIRTIIPGGLLAFYAAQNSPLVVVVNRGTSSNPPFLQVGTSD